MRWGRLAGHVALAAGVLVAGCGDERVDVFALPAGLPSDVDPLPLRPPRHEVTASDPPVGSRCTRLVPDITETRHVIGWRLVDASPAVRRFMVTYLGDVAAGDWMSADVDDEPGLDCSRLPTLPRRWLLVGSREAPEGVLPPGTGLAVEPDDQLVVIVEHDANGVELPTTASLRLELLMAREPVEAVVLARALFTTATVESGHADLPTLPGADAKLYGTFGVMNDLGAEISLELIRDGVETTLLEESDWVPAAQRVDFFEEPIDVGEGTLGGACSYARSEPIAWGLAGATEPQEVCVGGFYLGDR